MAAIPLRPMTDANVADWARALVGRIEATKMLDRLEKFCREGESRFVTMTFMSSKDGTQDWEVAVCLDDGETCDGPRVIGSTRWLQRHAGTLPGALEQVVRMLPTVRKLKRSRA